MSFKHTDLISVGFDGPAEAFNPVTCAGLSLRTLLGCILLSILAEEQRESQLPVLMQQLRQTLNR